jgi:hypothetical protein
MGLMLAAIAALFSLMPAQAAHAASTQTVTIDFFNDGWFYAYADVWAYDINGNEVGHDWTGTLGHGGHNKLIVAANAETIHVLIRLDPTGDWIHDEWINPWWNYGCSKVGEKPTEYVGGTIGHYNTYPLHCRK